jgi:peroxiredoxin
LIRQLTLLTLGATLLTWSGTGFPTVAQDHHAGHGATQQRAHGTDDKRMQQMMSGLSAAEKKTLREHMAQVPPAHRKAMTDHLLRMSLSGRRKMVQQMTKGHGTGSRMPDPGKHGDGKKDGHRTHGTHDAHGANRHPARHTGPETGKGKQGDKPETVPLTIGDKVPDFEVRDLQGKTYRLSDLQKQTKSGIVSLTFWCSFCHSCREVEARMDRFAKEHKGQAVIAALDASAGETGAGVAAFAKQTGLSLPILMDAPGKAADLFGVKVTTTTVVIDGQGTLRYRGRFLDGDQMFAQDALKAMLGGKPVTRKETALRG